MFIDNASVEAYLTIIADGDTSATGRKRAPAASRTRNDLTIRMKKDKAMTTFRNFALQAGATLALSGLLGIILFTFADYATSGVIA